MSPSHMFEQIVSIGAGLFGPNICTPLRDPCKFTSYEMLPFSCSSSQDVHNKDHHHKEVDDEAKSKDVIPENHWYF